ncbi:MAG: sulfurtransferase TusA family protein [Parvibaculum sp.]
MSEDILLDVTGLTCPIPVLRAQKRLRALTPGTILRVLATDPMAAIDVPHFCHESGHELLESTNEGRTLIFRIKAI